MGIFGRHLKWDLGSPHNQSGKPALHLSMVTSYKTKWLGLWTCFCLGLFFYSMQPGTLWYLPYHPEVPESSEGIQGVCTNGRVLRWCHADESRAIVAIVEAEARSRRTVRMNFEDEL